MTGYNYYTLLLYLYLYFLTIVYCVPTPSSSSPVANYIGCYHDNADVSGRTLPMAQLLDEQMNVQKCLIYCAE